MIADARLDHVALAVELWRDAWPRYVGDLGGRWGSCGRGPGFAPMQVRYANDMRLELLEPNDVEHNDFLRRFLDRHGPGPHHLTYKVGDIATAIAELESGGFIPVNVDLSDPEWKEAFVHPKQVGVVVQIAEAVGGAWETPPVAGFPDPARPPASLLRITHAVASLDDGLRLFRDVLGGTEVAAGEDDAVSWVELAWSGPGRLRLVSPASAAGPLAEWLEGRTGRLHHLAFARPDPAGVPGARPLGDGTYEVEPGDANGVRLILASG